MTDSPKRPPKANDVKSKQLRTKLLVRLNELSHGHIHIEHLKIKYDIPEEAISYHYWKSRIAIFIATSLIGCIAVGFAILSDESGHIFEIIYQYQKYTPFVLTPFGLVFIRWLTYTFFKGAEGSGIPQVIASMNGGDCSKLLSLKAGFGKIIGTNLALLSGASVGREGPTAQLGAVIIYFFSKKVLKAPRIYTEKSLILAGAAAGVSAAFNTPIAGIVFAIEELGKAFYEKETSVLLMAIVVSGLCALSLSGPYFYFGATQVSLVGWEQLYAIPIGIFSGLSGGFFALILTNGSAWINKQNPKKIYMLTFLFGLIIAGIGFYTNGVTFGTGYEEAKFMLEGNKGESQYSLLKFIVTSLSYLSGVPGGIFAPTLSIGAGIGSWFIEVFNSNQTQPLVLLGMVSFFAGVIRAPITAVIIVSEMTHNHSLILPLLMSAVIAYACARFISSNSLYQTFANRYINKDQTPNTADKLQS